MRFLILLVAGLVAHMPTMAAQIFSAPPTEYITDIGLISTTAVAAGQRFEAAAPGLISFSFWIQANSGNLPLRAYLSDNFAPSLTGSLGYPAPLFTSALFSPDTAGKYTFQTGGVLLDPGTTYMAYLFPERIAGVPPTSSYNAVFLGSVCFSGVVANCTADFPFPLGVRWEDPFIDEQASVPLAFEVVYGDVVPEPTTVTMLATGLAGLAVARRRRIV